MGKSGQTSAAAANHQLAADGSIQPLSIETTLFGRFRRNVLEVGLAMAGEARPQRCEMQNAVELGSTALGCLRSCAAPGHSG
jgi:hypothetical protein